MKSWTSVRPKRQARGGEPCDDLEGLLAQDETDALRGVDHRPNAILQTQTDRLLEAQQRGFVDRILLLPIEGTLKRFSDHMGQCERIKTTVFPTQYSFLLWTIIWLFFILLPPALTPYLGWVAIPVAYLVGIVFVLIEAIGWFLEDPFENTVMDTPMTTRSAGRSRSISASSSAKRNFPRSSSR